jgi:hypothetical protein
MNNFNQIKFGLTTIGQTTMFKLRFNSIESELYNKFRAITYWQECKTTSVNGKTYYTIIGAFHSSQLSKFKNIKDISLNKRDLNKILEQRKELLEIENSIEIQEEYNKRTVQEDWYEYLTPLDQFLLIAGVIARFKTLFYDKRKS